MENSHIIARRTLEKNGQAFELQLDRPKPGTLGDYECRWSLVDSAGIIVEEAYAYGIDELQALLSAVLTVGQGVKTVSTEFTFMGMTTTLLPLVLDSSQPGVTAWYIPNPAESN